MSVSRQRAGVVVGAVCGLNAVEFGVGERRLDAASDDADRRANGFADVGLRHDAADGLKGRGERRAMPGEESMSVPSRSKTIEVSGEQAGDQGRRSRS